MFRRLEWRVIAALVAAMTVLVLLNGINTFTFHSELFIIENEQNLPTWFSSILLAFGAAACLLAGMADRHWIAWGPLAAALAFFSMDEIAMIHERFEEEVGEARVVEVAEPIGAAVALAIAFLMVRRLSGLTRLLIVTAGACLLMAQLFSAANSALDLSYNVSNVVSIGEELWEMLMATLVLAAAAPYALRTLSAVEAPSEYR